MVARIKGKEERQEKRKGREKEKGRGGESEDA